MVAVEKKEQDKGEALLGDDTVVNVSYTVEAWSLQEGLPPLYLATIKDFLCFIVAVAEEPLTTDRKGHCRFNERLCRVALCWIFSSGGQPSQRRG